MVNDKSTLENEITDLQKVTKDLDENLGSLNRIFGSLKDRARRLNNVYNDAIYNEKLSTCINCTYRHDGSNLHDFCVSCKIDYFIRHYEEKNNIPAYRRF